MKTLRILAALVAVLLAMTTSASASGVSVDKKAIYDKGCIFFENQRYQEAMEQFDQLEQLGGYQDSRMWKTYCKGFVDIATADRLESTGYRTAPPGDSAADYISAAQSLFNVLSLQSFQDSANMKKYCIARGFELKGFVQNAIDIYAEIINTMDSLERYLRLIDPSNTPWPTQAPVRVLPPRLLRIPARAERKITTYMGPGSAYRTQSAVTVNSASELYICGREGNYYLIEIKTANGLLRCWGVSVYIVRNGAGAETEIRPGGSGFVLKTAEGLYGPGDEYMKTGITVSQNTRVTVYGSEGEYTMIEFTPAGSDKIVRVWIPTENVR